MPRYDFNCLGCGLTFEDRVPVGEDWAICPACENDGKRQFSLTPHIQTPEYFRLQRGWHLPDKDDKPAWERREALQDRLRVPKVPTLKETVEDNLRRYKSGKMPVEEFRSLVPETP